MFVQYYFRCLLLGSLCFAFAALAAESPGKTDDAKYAGAFSDHAATRSAALFSLDDIIELEDFNGEDFPPDGWTQIMLNQGDSATWIRNSLAPFEGSGYASCYFDSMLSPQDEWLISWPVDLSDTTVDWQVSFHWQTSYYWAVEPNDNFDLELRISLDGGDSFTDDVLWSEDQFGIFGSFIWYETLVDLSAYGGQSDIALGWRYVGADGAQADIDLVTVESFPPGGTLSGTVTNDANSSPISGVTVALEGTEIETSTVVGGHYSIAHIPPAAYSVHFSHPSFNSVTFDDLEIVHGETISLNVALEPVTIPVNDDCDEPQAISGSGVYPYSTVSATLDEGTPVLPDSCSAASPIFAPDLWYAYTASGDGQLVVSTCSSADYDTRLACYSLGTAECPLCPEDNSAVYACNDDAGGCSGYTSYMEFAVTAGVCYLLRVGGWSGAVGVGNLTVQFSPPPYPVVDVDPAAIDFGNVAVDSTADVILSIHNAGGAVLFVTEISVPEPFSVFPIALAISPGVTRTVTVTFAPQSWETFSEELTIVSDDPSGPSVVPVFGGADAVDDLPMAEEYYIARSYPNPFNPATTIRFAIPKAKFVRVAVFNSLGQEVAVLNDRLLDAGRHDFLFSGTDLPSGLYFARITSAGFNQTLKTVLLK